jgi:RAD51-like protein 1
MYCQDNKKIPTSLQSLDGHLLGGLPAGTLTEIAGPSGCGKTQFSMMLTVIADLPQHHGGIDSKTIYIDTEGAFTASRLIEIAKSRHPDYYSHEEAVKRLTDRVIIYKVTSCAELDTRLMSLDFTVASEEIGLVIVDSIASLIRKEYDTRSVKRISDRSCYLVKQATLLKCLAQDYQIPVVVTNHITTRFVPGTCDGQVVASLGNHWSHCINTRLVMEFTDDNNRMITVTKSSLCPPISIITRLEDKGLVLDCADLSEDFELKGDPNEHLLTVRTDLL